MKLRHLPVLLGLMLLVGPAFAQTIVHDESINGELSDSGATPTPVTLVLGLNTIEGSLGGLGAGGGGGASNGNDADIFTFTVAAGQTVNSITTTRSDSDSNVGFIGYSNTSSIGAISDNATLAAAIQAGGLFGNNSIGPAGDLSPIPTTLGAGDHTFILQETAAPTDFSISFNVAQAIPEPSSAALLSGLTLLGLVRRRRS